MADLAGTFESMLDPFRRFFSVPPVTHDVAEAVLFLDIEGDSPNAWGDDPQKAPPGQRHPPEPE